MSKHEVIEKAVEWVNLFIDYYDMKIGDITFKLLSVEISNRWQSSHKS